MSADPKELEKRMQGAMDALKKELGGLRTGRASVNLLEPVMVAEQVPCGPDLERHVRAIERFAEAGFDEVYLQQIGDGHERFFEIYAREILPRFGGGGRGRLST